MRISQGQFTFEVGGASFARFKELFSPLFRLKLMISPRQARDKHRENSKKRDRCLRFERVQFENNSAWQGLPGPQPQAGGLLRVGGTAEIVNCSFRNAIAQLGGCLNVRDKTVFSPLSFKLIRIALPRQARDKDRGNSKKRGRSRRWCLAMCQLRTRSLAPAAQTQEGRLRITAGCGFTIAPLSTIRRPQISLRQSVRQTPFLSYVYT